MKSSSQYHVMEKFHVFLINWKNNIKLLYQFFVNFASFSFKKILTGISLITHVKFAAGLENSDEQLTRTTSPGRYLFSSPSIVGFVSGISMNNRKFGLKSRDIENIFKISFHTHSKC